MSKKIELIKITSAEQDIAMLNAAAEDQVDKEQVDIIERKKASEFYEHATLAQFGDFMIMLNDQIVGFISLDTHKDSNFVFNGTVNIEFSYGLTKQAMGKGLMTEVLQLAIQYVKTVKDAHQDMRFIEYGYSPEEHPLLTAQKIGDVYVNVIDISNYPSLSCCIRAGGQVEGLRNGGAIKVNFLCQESTSHFSEALTSDLMKYSKTLCQLGFDSNYRSTPPSIAEKGQASKASETFIKQVVVEDVESLSTIEFFVKNHILESAQASTYEPTQIDTACNMGSEVSLITEQVIDDSNVL
jgi:hypothetical protein